jgi:mannose-6-phosphate isomerase-like protein (cupin superfamily)
MDSIKYVREGDRLLAIIVRAGFAEPGTTPFTDEGLPLQMSIMNKQNGEMMEPHIHPPVEAEPRGEFRQEMLHVVAGRMEVGVHSRSGELIETVLLRTGDMVLLTEGHSTRFLEETKVLEIKQGPYPGKDSNKTWL